MKSIDSIPEKWIIRLTEENLSTVGAYYNKIARTTCYTEESAVGHYLASHHMSQGESVISGQSSGGNYICSSDMAPEITTEQFIKYVLKQNTHYEIY